MSAGAGRYARAIEELWGRACARPVVLSPREWALVADWHARGIPLTLIREAVEEASRKRRRSKGPRSLSYVAPAVEAAWQTVVDGRIETAGPGRGPIEGPSAAEAWRRRAEEERLGTELRDLLERLLGALEGGCAAEEADAELENRLPSVLPVDLLREVERDVDARLATFAARMRADVLASTRQRAVMDRLRQITRLPRLREPSTS